LANDASAAAAGSSSWVFSDKFSIYTSNLELQHAVFSILQDFPNIALLKGGEARKKSFRPRTLGNRK
jgi:hypothetical protein